MKPSDASVGMTASLLWLRSGGGGELGGEGVERERTEQVAADARGHLVDGGAGALNPSEGQSLSEAVELGTQVNVAQEFGGAGFEQEEVFEDQREGAEERGGLLLSIGSGAIGFGHLEEGGVVGIGGGVAACCSRGVAQEDEGSWIAGSILQPN